MHSKKKLQKKETSAPMPKKYLEYEVSQGEMLGEAHWNRPPWPGTIVTVCISCFTTGGPGKEHRTNKPPPTRRVWERSKGDTTCAPTSQNPSLWHPSWLNKAAPPGRMLSQNDWLRTTWKLIPSPQNPRLQATRQSCSGFPYPPALHPGALCH